MIEQILLNLDFLFEVCFSILFKLQKTSKNLIETWEPYDPIFFTTYWRREYIPYNIECRIESVQDLNFRLGIEYMQSSTYANFISENLITAIFQNFQKIFGLCIFRAIYFITAIFWPEIAVMK